MSRPRILVIGWIGSTNLGDELIAEQICRLLAEAGCDASIVTIDRESSARLGVPMILHKSASESLSLLRAIRSFDGVVFGGGGLIQDETGPLNIPFHMSRLAAARILGKPWVGVGLGIGDVRRRGGRLLVRSVLRNAVAVGVRDEASSRRHLALTGRQAIVLADPVFLTDVPQTVPDHNLVVSLRRENTAHQRRLRTAAPPDAKRVSRWAEIIDAIAEPRGLGVRFVAWEREQDAPLHDSVGAMLRSPFVTETPTADEIIQRMGSGSMVLTMRYHGAIAAMLHHRPCVVINYSPKMADLVAETHGGAALVEVEATAPEIINAFDSIADQNSARADALAELRTRAGGSVALIDQLVARAGRDHRRRPLRFLTRRS